MFPISLIQETWPKDPCPKLGKYSGGGYSRTLQGAPSAGTRSLSAQSSCWFPTIVCMILPGPRITPKPCKRNFFDIHPYSPSSFIINKSPMIIIHEWERQHWQRLELWTPLEPQVNFFSLLFRASSFHLPWFAFSSPEFFLLIFCLLLEYLQ